jgi:nitrite reductase/ring-hydroxylating ferredoxin subunit
MMKTAWNQRLEPTSGQGRGEPESQANTGDCYTRGSRPSTKGKMTTRIKLCAATDVAPGTALKVETGDLVVAVFNVNGAYYVTDDHCTHGPGSLSEGYIEDDIVECNFHNGQFNIRTGEVVSPPCMVPVKTYPAVVEGGVVYIDV